MPTIIISEQTMRLIQDNVLPGRRFQQTAVQIRGGLWELWVDEEVRDRINIERVPGEPDDAVLERILRTAVGSKPN
jgi:hypothetical protein